MFAIVPSYILFREVGAELGLCYGAHPTDALVIAIVPPCVLFRKVGAKVGLCYGAHPTDTPVIAIVPLCVLFREVGAKQLIRPCVAIFNVVIAFIGTTPLQRLLLIDICSNLVDTLSILRS